MSFNFNDLLLAGITFLTLLFGAAYITERGWIPRHIIRHPLIYVLSLGIYASAWTFYGTFGLAQQSGYSFLASYLGASAAFFLAPLVLIPILRITRKNQLSSLADLFAFRFRSAGAGTMTALMTVVATLPLISIQIQAVADSLHILSSNFSSNRIALGFCSIIALFSILFGARYPSLKHRHAGLVVAMATSSLFKLIALGGIGLYAFFDILGGPSGLNQWFEQQPIVLETFYTPLDSDTWRTMLVSFFAAAIVMPHMFHMIFTENTSSESLYKASWGVPLYLLLMALAIPPILWAGMKLQLANDPEFLILHLGIGIQSEFLTMLAFIGGLAASSGIIIVATVSMASMLQNHLILPLLPAPKTQRFYSWLLWLRRSLIIALMLGSYFFYINIGKQHDLHLLGTIAFIAFLQFLPGVIATLFWASANRIGFICGVIAGMSIWLVTMLAPLFNGFDSSSFLLSYPEIREWHQAAMYSLVANIFVFVLLSVLLDNSPEEFQAASACLVSAPQQLSAPQLTIKDSNQYISLLTPRLGRSAAYREVNAALHELDLANSRLSPVNLLRLHVQIENNLSGLLGPIEAASLLRPASSQMPDAFKTRDVNLLENQLETYHAKLTGLAAELDNLRRHHRSTLQKLPIGACSLDDQGKIILWNAEMELLTELPHAQVLGKTLDELPAPWADLLHNFALEEGAHLLSQRIKFDNHEHWFSLHKASLAHDTDAAVILVEDETEHQTLVNKLSHSERLASIGRFAAGVAHEVGNPVTGIACLAQNLKLETDSEPVLETGEQILTQTKRITRIVQSLVRFAHTGQGEEQEDHLPLNLHELISEAIHLVSLDTRSKQISFINETPAGMQISGDPQRLLQVFVNLLNNASDASEEQDEICIEAAYEEGSIVIRVTDQGSGISAEHQAKIFEPFFTTKDPDKGTGLGLSLVYNIIIEHYGSINIVSPANNKQNKGTQVVITLPIPATDSST
ncbi:sensor histidine kinase [Aliamphritea hakodatensis]|uniref:sensor histidine kinase n=1 Tax=Aliamphritea hakodatensis TaxID=2895352 RepID=UPI0022FD6C98|nr:ATP-binding protein [Aliamphritea hakodatensis]